MPAQVLRTQPLPERPAPYLDTADQFEDLPAGLWLVRLDSRVDVPADLDAADLADLTAPPTTRPC